MLPRANPTLAVLVRREDEVKSKRRSKWKDKGGIVEVARAAFRTRFRVVGVHQAGGFEVSR